MEPEDKYRGGKKLNDALEIMTKLKIKFSKIPYNVNECCYGYFIYYHIKHQ